MYNNSIRDRFWKKVSVSDNSSCWNWNAAKFGNGYGHFVIGKGKGRNKLSHRVAFEIYFGKISKGMVLDHKCKNKSCVNPYHLEQVTKRENTMRGDNPASRNNRKTHCIHGHPLSGDNLYVWRNQRHCKICRNNIVENSRRKHRIAKMLVVKATRLENAK